MTSEIKREAIRYLLGTATAEEQSALEEKYFSNPDLFQQVVAVEKELLDDYARDRLSSEERELFERHYLAHPKRRVRAKTAIALTEKLRQSKPLKIDVGQRAWWQDWSAGFRARSLAFAMTAAALLLALGTIWLWLEIKRLRSELDRFRIAQTVSEGHERALQGLLAEQQNRNNQLAAELERLRTTRQTSTNPSMRSFVSLLLIAGLARDGNPANIPRLVIPPGIEQVRLYLKIKEAGYSQYRLSLETVGGQTLRTLPSIRPDLTNIMTLTFPSSLFSTGEYVLALSGINNNGESDSLSKTLFHVETRAGSRADQR